MENKNKFIQVYAVVVCVVAIITFLISASNFISSAMDRASADDGSVTYSSFENYKMEKMKNIDEDQAYIPNDEELRNMYQSGKERYVENNIQAANKSMVVNGIIMGIAIILFGFHWRLMRKFSAK
jgi:hypothetical protein